jgi:peptidoglycan/LPS O-acetylase OafA/YrhL
MRSTVFAIWLGIALQVAMVVVGHFVPPLRDYWGPGGMLISLLAGGLSVVNPRARWLSAATSGALAGGIGALLGIAVAFALRDVPALLILLGTISSTVAGVIGSSLRLAVARRNAGASG